MTKSRLIASAFLCAATACSDTADTSPDDPALTARAGDSVKPVGDARTATTARSDSPTDRACGITERTVLTPEGIGELRVGMPVAQARARCRVLRDSVSVHGEAEGMPMKLLIVDFGRDTISAEPLNDRIFRLWIDGPAFRTADGLGVGSTVADLRARGSARVALGEGTFILLTERCGLSFELGDPRLPSAIQRFGPGMSPANLPQDVRVVGVLVYPCDPTHAIPPSP